MFGPDTRYYIVLWGFIIGFFLPLPGWLAHRYFPNWGLDKINTPMILVGLTLVPGQATSWITVSFMLAFISQYYIKTYHRNWFVKYNYLLSTAFDSATSLMVFFVAFALNGAADGEVHQFPVWWGNRLGKLQITALNKRNICLIRHYRCKLRRSLLYGLCNLINFDRSPPLHVHSTIPTYKRFLRIFSLPTIKYCTRACMYQQKQAICHITYHSSRDSVEAFLFYFLYKECLFKTRIFTIRGPNTKGPPVVEYIYHRGRK